MADKDPEARRLYQRMWAARNRARLRERILHNQRARYHADDGRVRDYKRRWRRQHPEIIRTANARNYRTNRTMLRKRARDRWRRNRREVLREIAGGVL